MIKFNLKITKKDNNLYKYTENTFLKATFIEEYLNNFVSTYKLSIQWESIFNFTCAGNTDCLTIENELRAFKKSYVEKFKVDDINIHITWTSSAPVSIL